MKIIDGSLLIYDSVFHNLQVIAINHFAPKQEIVKINCTNFLNILT